MKFSFFKRNTGKKGETKRIRREGNIPCNLYGHQQAGEAVYIKGDDIHAFMRNLQRNSGTLSTTIFELEDGQKKHRAIIKEIQYHPVSYAVMHIDFALLSDKAPITLNVPIELAGTVDCVGVKLGGFIRQTIRTLKVTCLPKYIPEKFVLDVRDLGVAQSKKLSDIVMSEHIRPKGKMDEVAVIVGKKAGAA